MSVMPVMQKHSELFSFFDVKFRHRRATFLPRLGDFDGILDLWRLKLSGMFVGMQLLRGPPYLEGKTCVSLVASDGRRLKNSLLRLCSCYVVVLAW